MDQRSRSRSSSSANSERNSRPPFNPGDPSKKVFVGGLPDSATENELREMFSTCGNVNDFFMKKPAEGSPFAFVEFLTLNEAQMAIETFNGKRMGEKMISVKYSKPKNSDGRKEGGNDNGDRKPQRDFNNNGNQGQRRDFGGDGNNGPRNGGQFNSGNRDNQRNGGGFGGQREFQPRKGSEERNQQGQRGGYRGGYNRNNDRGGGNDRGNNRGGYGRGGYGNGQSNQGNSNDRDQKKEAPRKQSPSEDHDY